MTKRGQIWFSHPLSADLESELYSDTGVDAELVRNDLSSVLVLKLSSKSGILDA